MYGPLGVHTHISQNQGKTNSTTFWSLWFVIVPRWYVVRVRVYGAGFMPKGLDIRV